MGLIRFPRYILGTSTGIVSVWVLFRKPLVEISWGSVAAIYRRHDLAADILVLACMTFLSSPLSCFPSPGHRICILDVSVV